MRTRVDLVTMVMAVWVAAYAAVGIGYVAHYEFGLSRYQIRGIALAVALAVATLIVIKPFRKKARSPD